MIILFGAQKGGCGKSTLAINFAAVLARAGADVILVDADRQATSANWCADRSQNPELPRVNCVQRYDNIRDTLLDLRGRYQYVIVDAAGRDSRELRTGMTAADILIVPFRPSQPDLDTLPALDTIVEEALDINPDLKVFAALTMAPTNPTIDEVREAREYLADYPKFRFLKTIISDRKSYRDAMSEGLSVVEMKNPKAAGEIDVLVQEVLSHG